MRWYRHFRSVRTDLPSAAAASSSDNHSSNMRALRQFGRVFGCFRHVDLSGCHCRIDDAIRGNFEKSAFKSDFW